MIVWRQYAVWGLIAAVEYTINLFVPEFSQKQKNNTKGHEWREKNNNII